MSFPKDNFSSCAFYLSFLCFGKGVAGCGTTTNSRGPPLFTFHQPFVKTRAWVRFCLVSSRYVAMRVAICAKDTCASDEHLSPQEANQEVSPMRTRRCCPSLREHESVRGESGQNFQHPNCAFDFGMAMGSAKIKFVMHFHEPSICAVTRLPSRRNLPVRFNQTATVARWLLPLVQRGGKTHEHTHTHTCSTNKLKVKDPTLTKQQ